MFRTVLLLAAAGLSSLLPAGDKDKEDKKAEARKGKRPALELRMLPRFSFSPANVHFTAELTGGDDLEEFYCPDVEWEWGDGGKSEHESDCAPFEEGTKLERHFSADHLYMLSGNYTAKVTLRRAGKTIAAQTLQVVVRPGFGERRPGSPE
jgi:hypothetical protein